MENLKTLVSLDLTLYDKAPFFPYYNKRNETNNKLFYNQLANRTNETANIEFTMR